MKYTGHTIKIRSTDAVTVTDVSFNKGEYATLVQGDFLGGDYRHYADVWSNRVWHSAILHKDYAERFVESKDKLFDTVYEGHIDVISGFAGFFIDKPDFSQREWEAFQKKHIFTKAEGDTLILAFQCPSGVFSYTSGCNEDSFPVYSIWNGKYRIGLMLDF